MLYSKQITSSSLSLSHRYWNYLSILYDQGSAMPGLRYFIAICDFSGFTACSAYLSLKLKYGFFLPVSSPRNVSFPVAPRSLPLSETQGSPDCSPSLSFSLSPILVAHLRRLVALLIHLGYSFSKIQYIPCVSFISAEGRDITRSPLTVHWAVQFYLVICHEEEKSIVFSNVK